MELVLVRVIIVQDYRVREGLPAVRGADHRDILLEPSPSGGVVLQNVDNDQTRCGGPSYVRFRYVTPLRRSIGDGRCRGPEIPAVVRCGEHEPVPVGSVIQPNGVETTHGIHGDGGVPVFATFTGIAVDYDVIVVEQSVSPAAAVLGLGEPDVRIEQPVIGPDGEESPVGGDGHVQVPLLIGARFVILNVVIPREFSRVPSGDARCHHERDRLEYHEQDQQKGYRSRPHVCTIHVR